MPDIVWHILIGIVTITTGAVEPDASSLTRNIEIKPT